MKRISEWKDAKKSLWAAIKPRHALHCKKRDSENCVNARAILSLPGVKKVKVFQRITYVWFEGDILPTRYQNSAEAYYFACLNDTGGRKAIIDEIRDEIKENGAIRVEMQVPTGHRSKTYLRSPRMKATRRRSAARRLIKDLNGEPPQKYTRPSNEGMRSGQGKALTWDDDE